MYRRGRTLHVHLSYGVGPMSKALENKGKVPRQNRIKRLLSMTSEDSALSITEIAEKLNTEGFNINRKTVERDVDDISEDQDYPLSETDSNPTRFFCNGELPQNYELIFDENQLQTIIMALQSLKQMSPKVIKDLCLEVESTLITRLPKTLASEFGHLKSISNAAPTILGEGADIDPGVLQTVLHCLRKGKVFECVYSSADDLTPSARVRSFAPLKLHFVGSPYIYVYDTEDSVIKMLRISRIHSVSLTEKSVNKSRAREIKLDHVFGGYGKGTEKIIHYSITCAKPMALRFNEQKIHPSQKIEVLKDGFYKITFSVHDSLEVTRLLAQYGEWIKEISPESEYDRVKEIWKKGLKAS
jgi:predicted DNA-binding transcriptional regulator YafY